MRSIALYLEGDGDGARLCEALAECAERGVGVAVLKVGASAAGAAAAAAHTGAVAGDQRVFRALVEEAGAAWAADVHELLELAKAWRCPGARRREATGGGLAVLTCSGGDSALAADECERLGRRAARARARDRRAPARAAARGGHGRQPARLHRADLGRDGHAARHHRDRRRRTRRSTRCSCSTTSPPAIGRAAGSWAAVREGIRAGAAASPVPVLVASTLPELLDEDAARALHRRRRARGRGAAHGAGLRGCAAARPRRPGAAARDRRGGAAAARAPALRRHRGAGSPSTRRRGSCAKRGVPVVDGPARRRRGRRGRARSPSSAAAWR